MMESAKQSTANVLIIDDSRVQRDVMKKMLHFTNYKVTTVGSGEEALSLIKDEKASYDVILLDLEMPNFSGVEILTKLRKLSGKNSKTMVIAATGNKKEFSADDFKNMGFNAAIIKPINVSDLIEIMDHLVYKEPGHWEGVVQRKETDSLF